MTEIDFVPSGVCCRRMRCSLDDEGRIRNASFTGGCNGNLQAVARLVDGMTPEQAHGLLADIRCGRRETSCAAEFVKGLLRERQKENGNG